MRFACWFLVVGLATVAALPLGAQPPTVFEPQVERHEGPPLWISAKAIVDKEKGLNLDLIGSGFLRDTVAEERREMGMTEKNGASEAPAISNIPYSECVQTLDIQDGRGSGLPDATLEALTRAKAILRGRIRSIDVGFSRGVPSSLLEVELLEVVKGRTPPSPFYVDYLVAQFKIGPFHFCNTNKGFEPLPGDEILLFDFTGTSDRDHLLYAPALDGIFFQRQRSGIFFPPRMKNSPDLRTVQSLDNLVARLRSEIRGLHLSEERQR